MASCRNPCFVPTTLILVAAMGAVLHWQDFEAPSLADAPLKKFVQPTDAQRTAAIGPTRRLAASMVRALTPGSNFAPVPDPGPNDWLANHHEAGQTFSQYTAGQPNIPDRKRTTIYLQPLGDLGGDRSPPLKDLADVCAATFGLPVEIQPVLDLTQQKLTSRVNPGTRKPQYLTLDILALLRKSVPANAYCLLAITQEDLYPQESWNFVFGQASLRDRVGVYSFARFDPEFFGDERPEDYRTLLLERSCGTLIHETAHMFGMQHCIYFHCVLNGSNNQTESDAAPLHFCPVCLRKLHWATRFDIAVRYRESREAFERLGLTDEAAWVQKRLEVIEETR